MKISKYTIGYQEKDVYIFYNSASDKVMLCVEEVKRLIEENREQADRIRLVHPVLYNYLKINRFIVPEEENETQNLIDKLREECDDNTSYSITINPTMNCNLRCWYCYEEHMAGSMMDTNVLNSVKLLFQCHITNDKTKNFHISYFGGEPLLGFNQCVRPLTDYAQILCKEHNVEMTLSFTTNAVLLTKEKVDYLIGTGLPIYMQIPFDGDRIIHDNVKKLRNGNGTYDVILQNLSYAVEKGIHILVRCNYTADTATSFRGLINDIEQIRSKYPLSIEFSFQRVWQDAENKEAEQIIDQLIALIDSRNGVCTNRTPSPERCYADKRNSFVINWNGDIYQCTARKFSSDTREGKLLPDGTIEYNARYEQRMNSRFSNPECLACSILPICSLCTQKRMEWEPGVCLYSNPEYEKTQLIRNRVANLRKLRRMEDAEKAKERLSAPQ